MLLSRTLALALIAVAIAPPCTGQVEVDTAAVLARVRAGGRFEETKWRRGRDGQLEMHFFADMGEQPAGPLRFQPLLGKDFDRGLMNSGVVGWLAMVCHGPDDLLAMTDAEFHLGALGIETTDVGLRQYLALSRTAFEDSDRGRAELMDRMVAIDLLVRRGSKGAVAELQGIAQGEGPAPLKARAQRAIARLLGRTDGAARKRLTPETLNLPLNFDGCVLIDHSRLPDLGWLTPLGRRLSALVTAAKVEAAGGTISAAMCNGAQMMCDVVGELPFGLVLKNGNARFDHSCIVITAKNDPELPVALSWQAVGEFEAEGWQQAEATEREVRNNPLLGGQLLVNDDGVQATLGGGAGKPRPAKGKELLRDDGSAIRVIVPKTSKLWPALRFLELPAALGAELSITFGDPATIVLCVEARDEDGAEEWAETGKATLGQSVAEAERQLPAPLRENVDIKRLRGELAAAAITVEGAAVTVKAELSGVTPAVIARIAEALVVPRF